VIRRTIHKDSKDRDKRCVFSLDSKVSKEGTVLTGRKTDESTVLWQQQKNNYHLYASAGLGGPGERPGGEDDLSDLEAGMRSRGVRDIRWCRSIQGFKINYSKSDDFWEPMKGGREPGVMGLVTAAFWTSCRREEREERQGLLCKVSCRPDRMK